MIIQFGELTVELEVLIKTPRYSPITIFELCHNDTQTKEAAQMKLGWKVGGLQRLSFELLRQLLQLLA